MEISHTIILLTAFAALLAFYFSPYDINVGEEDE
jgi:hypothetical protein